MKKIVILAIVLTVLIFCIAGLKIVGESSVKAYLKSHATQWTVATSADRRFHVMMFQYPRLYDVPESFGFGQGFVQLQDSTGRVLAEKEVKYLAQLNWFKWSSNKVAVADFVEWCLPP
jgi:hypothetical protein